MEIAVFKSNSVFIFYKNILGKIFAFLNFNGFHLQGATRLGYKQ